MNTLTQQIILGLKRPETLQIKHQKTTVELYASVLEKLAWVSYTGDALYDNIETTFFDYLGTANHPEYILEELFRNREIALLACRPDKKISFRELTAERMLGLMSVARVCNHETGETVNGFTAEIVDPTGAQKLKTHKAAPRPFYELEGNAGDVILALKNPDMFNVDRKQSCEKVFMDVYSIILERPLPVGSMMSVHNAVSWYFRTLLKSAEYPEELLRRYERHLKSNRFKRRCEKADEDEIEAVCHDEIDAMLSVMFLAEVEKDGNNVNGFTHSAMDRNMALSEKIKHK